MKMNIIGGIWMTLRPMARLYGGVRVPYSQAFGCD
jgi:hypothetical protein